MLLTTQKDATRLTAFKGILRQIKIGLYAIPIEVAFLTNLHLINISKITSWYKV